MKIIKYIKKKDNRYEIILDDNKYLLYEDVILKYDLLLKKNIDTTELNSILKDNIYEEAYNKALKYINTKLRCKKEIIKYLNNYDKDIIDYVINKLIKNNYLNNKLYISSYINDSLLLSNKGYNKILNELLNLDFNREEIINHLDNIDLNIWEDRIIKYIDKKSRCNNKYSINYLKNKILNELINLGYERTLINNCLENINSSNEDEIIEKEYNKIYNSLSKKYTSKELEFNIIRKLLSKGFNYDDIKNIISKNKNC